LRTTRAAYLKIPQAIVLQIQFVIVQIDVWHFEILTKDLSAKQMDLMQVAPDPLVSKELLYATEEEAQTASATRLEEVKIYAASRTSRVSQLLPA
jgi:hypothetical protein